MSRIGKKPIEIPEGVSVFMEEKKLLVKGKNGTLEQLIQKDVVDIEMDKQWLTVKLLQDTKRARSYHGLIRALIQNMIRGVENNFSKVLIAEGVGYKFQLDKEKLIVNVGFSHPVLFSIPSDIKVKVESNTKLSLTGMSKEKVGFFASTIRSIRPPEPYKAKGIQYEGEKILRKAGKTGK